jgi:DNA-binding MarR family transcriptional regulator
MKNDYIFIKKKPVEILLLICENPGITQDEISRLIFTDKCAFNHILQDLKEKGLITGSRGIKGRELKYNIILRGLDLTISLDKVVRILNMKLFDYKKPEEGTFLKPTEEGLINE